MPSMSGIMKSTSTRSETWRVAQTTASTGRAKPSTATRSSRLRTTCSRMARPVDWSSTTITVLRAEGRTLSSALAMSPPLLKLPCGLPRSAYARAMALSSRGRPENTFFFMTLLRNAEAEYRLADTPLAVGDLQEQPVRAGRDVGLLHAEA